MQNITSIHSTRVLAPALEKILGRKFKVLDDGFIRVVDYMGNDSSVVQAARVSYGKGTKTMMADRALIRYLMRHLHTSPFEMCEIKLHVRVPMDCWRQWIRHRTANVNEYSTRYSVAIASTQSTAPNAWRIQSVANKQGSGEFASNRTGTQLTHRERKLHDQAREVYQERLNLNIAREQARKDLPLSTYTEAYWKIDLHNLLHFLRLRMDISAQYEIRSYATLIGEKIVSKWCPLVWEAFREYRLGVVNLSHSEIELIRLIKTGNRKKALAFACKSGLVSVKEGKIANTREWEEFQQKLRLLGFPSPAIGLP